MSSLWKAAALKTTATTRTQERSHFPARGKGCSRHPVRGNNNDHDFTSYAVSFSCCVRSTRRRVRPVVALSDGWCAQESRWHSQPDCPGAATGGWKAGFFRYLAHSQTHSLQPCASKFIPGGTEIGGSPLALDLGTDMTGGLPYQPWAAAAVKDRKADHGVDDPHVRCLPDNPPRPWVMPHLVKAVHSPKLLVLLYEVNAMYRQIFVDGRPSLDNPNPSWNGYSRPDGKATRSSSRPTVSAMTSGSIWVEAR
jgi:hypothetical protein